MTLIPVAKALIAMGHKARMIFSWDDYDRFRKVPANIDESYSKYIGLPLTSVPDIDGTYKSYAQRFQSEFEEVLKTMNIDVEFKYQTEEYTSGTYKDQVIHALKNRKEIADIILAFMSDKSKEAKGINETEFKENYYPISVYSRFTGKDNTEVRSFDNEKLLTYYCKDTDKEETIDLTKDFCVKLPWKVDWPMRWKHEDVNFEPGGKDHSTPGGSYDVSAIVSREIFKSEGPVFVGYDFISIRGIEGKMSSSKGNAMSPMQLLEIYTPEILEWLYERVPPNRKFELAFDSEIYRQYDEYDRFTGEEGEMPFRQMVGFGQIVNFDLERMMELIKGMGLNFKKDKVATRLPKAKNWLETYNPQEMVKLLEDKNTEYKSQMTKEDNEQVQKLILALESGEKSIEEWTEIVYKIPKEGQPEEKWKDNQKQFFKNVYNLLFDRNRGPRLGTYFWAIPSDKILKLLK